MTIACSLCDKLGTFFFAAVFLEKRRIDLLEEIKTAVTTRIRCRCGNKAESLCVIFLIFDIGGIDAHILSVNECVLSCRRLD